MKITTVLHSRTAPSLKYLPYERFWVNMDVCVALQYQPNSPTVEKKIHVNHAHIDS